MNGPREKVAPPDRLTTDQIRLTSFARQVLLAAGADPAEADLVADALVWADRVGRPTQGVWRLPILVKRLRMGLFQSPCVLDETLVSPSVVVVDGRDGLGHVVALRAMRRAIELAARSGVGAVGVRNGNHFGAAGFYALQAAEAGMVGIAMSNSFPKVAAYGGGRAVIGTNPLAFSAPRARGAPLLVDMATSERAGSALRWQTETRREGGGPVRADPDSGAPDRTEPLAPFGGAKGYGLGLMVEILAGALTGGGLSHQVRSLYGDFTGPGNNGHFFLALDPEQWTSRDRFLRTVEGFLASVEDSGTAGSAPVRTPGQERWSALARSDSEGIPLDPPVLDALEQVREELGLSPGW